MDFISFKDDKLVGTIQTLLSVVLSTLCERCALKKGILLCTHKDFLISLYVFFQRWDYRSVVAALKDESSWYHCGKLQNRRLCLHLKLVVCKNGNQIQPHLLLNTSNLNLSWTQLAACLNETGKHMLYSKSKASPWVDHWHIRTRTYLCLSENVTKTFEI